MKKAKVRDELESGLIQQAHIDVEQVSGVSYAYLLNRHCYNIYPPQEQPF